MFLITYLTTSSPNVFAAGYSDCTTSLPSPGVRPLHTLFHSVSSFSFYSAWTVPKCFLLGFLSLKLDPPLLDSLPGCHGQHLASDPRAKSISLSLFLGWPSGAWRGKPLAPLLQHVPQPLSVCAFVCMETRIQREEEGRRTGAQFFYPLYQGQWCCRLSDGGYKVGTQEEQRRGLPSLWCRMSQIHSSLMRWALSRKEGTLLWMVLGVAGQRDEGWKADVGGDVNSGKELDGEGKEMTVRKTLRELENRRLLTGVG